VENLGRPVIAMLPAPARPQPGPGRWPPVAWASGVVLALLPAALLTIFTYGYILEYGGELGAVVPVAAVTGICTGISAWCLLQLIRQRLRAPVGVWVAAAAVAAAVVTLTLGWLAQRQSTAERSAQEVACTPQRLAELAVLNLPGRADPPGGQRDGRCRKDPVVPGSIEHAEGLLRAALTAQGWASDGTEDGHARYRKGPFSLVVYDPYPMVDGILLPFGIR